MSTPLPALIELRHISKRFGQTRANNDISLEIKAGRVLALLGANGAGKSTLMSILAGRLMPDSGSILVNGTPTPFHSPKDAIAAGVGMVYQHFMLINTMSVAENVFLGQSTGLWLNPEHLYERTQQLVDHYGLKLNPRAKIATLSMGERQRVEILKLLARNSRVLIFDEPTAVLTPLESEFLFAAMRRMAEEGKAIVFISHKMPEVLDISDDIAILRQGEVVHRTLRSAVTSETALASAMMGHEVDLSMQVVPEKTGEPVLEVDALQVPGVDNVSFTVRRGEIFAIAGVAGNGQQELVRVLTGTDSPKSHSGPGSVRILGQSWQVFYKLPPDKMGIAYIPEDRQGVATCPTLDLTDNFLLTTRHKYSGGLFLNYKAARKAALETIGEYNVQPGHTRHLARTLSGGNLQKLVVGREFHSHPRLIIAENPTQGLDVSSAHEVWERLVQARSHAGIVLVTGELTEALELADRVAIMYRGRFIDVFSPKDQKKVAAIGLMMAGAYEAQPQE